MIIGIIRGSNFFCAGKGVLVNLQSRQALGFLPFKAFNAVLGGFQLTAKRAHSLLLCFKFFFLCQLLLITRRLQLHIG